VGRCIGGHPGLEDDAQAADVLSGAALMYGGLTLPRLYGDDPAVLGGAAASV